MAACSEGLLKNKRYKVGSLPAAQLLIMDAPTFVDGFHDKEAVKKLTYGRLGSTDMVTSNIGIGGCSAGNVYGVLEEQLSIDTITEAVKSGINFMDTSPAYGSGRSEEVIGKALRQLPRKSYYLATKVGRYGLNSWTKDFDFSGSRIEQSVDTSLKLLGVDYVDLIQVHDLEFALDLDQVINETLPTLQKIVKQGKARYIGITGYPLSALKEVLERSKVPINTVLTYARGTILDQELDNYMPFFQSRGVGVINASITAMSLLATPGPHDWHPATQDIKEAVAKAFKLCESRGVKLARLAVQASAATQGVAVNLLGCDNVNILRLNIDAATSKQTELEKELTAQIKEEFAKLPQRHWEGVQIADRTKALIAANLMPAK